MFRNYICLTMLSAITVSGCSVMSEQSPLYPQNQTHVYAQLKNTSYQTAQNYNVTPVSSEPISCPLGTKPHASGTCLLDNPNASLKSATFTGVQTRTIQRTEIPTRSHNIITTSATPIAPSSYRAADITGQSLPGNYRVLLGDTVYSLARKLCVPITAIQSYNGLDANYGIQIGQDLNLPTSQC